MECTCKFIMSGQLMDSRGCEVHTKHYGCDDCRCDDYRPLVEPRPAEEYWPLCICGHVAQDHNHLTPKDEPKHYNLGTPGWYTTLVWNEDQPRTYTLGITQTSATNPLQQDFILEIVDGVPIFKSMI